MSAIKPVAIPVIVTLPTEGAEPRTFAVGYVKGKAFTRNITPDEFRHIEGNRFYFNVEAWLHYRRFYNLVIMWDYRNGIEYKIPAARCDEHLKIQYDRNLLTDRGIGQQFYVPLQEFDYPGKRMIDVLKSPAMYYPTPEAVGEGAEVPAGREVQAQETKGLRIVLFPDSTGG